MSRQRRDATFVSPTPPSLPDGLGQRGGSEVFQAVWDTIREAVLIWDDDGRVVDINPAFTRMTGFGRAELIGTETSQLRVVPPKPGERDDLMRRLLEAGTLSGEVRIRTRDGAWLDCEYQSVSHIMPGVNLTTLRDVGARLAAQAANETRLRQLQDLADLGPRALLASELEPFLQEVVEEVAKRLNIGHAKILALDPDQRNLRIRAAIGWPQEQWSAEVVPATKVSQAGYTLLIDEPVHVDDLPSETRFKGMRILHDAGIRSGITVVIPGRNGPFGILGAHSTAPRVFSLDDSHYLLSIAHLVGAAVDRMRVERELERSRDQLHVVLESVADGITVQDREGRLIYANAAAAQLVGLESADDLIAKGPGQLVAGFELYDEHGRPFPLTDLPGRQVLLGGPPSETLLRYRVKKTGEEHWSLTKARPVHGPDGEVRLAVNIFQRVTELKRKERLHRLLSEAGRLLAQSLDPEERLAAVAQLAVPDFADWCAVDFRRGDVIALVAAAHSEPEMLELAYEFRERFPPGKDSGTWQVMESGDPQFVPMITDEMLEAVTDPVVLDYLRRLNLRSVMTVPLQAHGQVFGTLTFATAESRRTFSKDDLDDAVELARRVALAVDNARLYQRTQILNQDLERRVEERTTELAKSLQDLQSATDQALEAQAELAETQRRLLDSREVERRFLAQELHDGPLQDLHALSYQLEQIGLPDDQHADLLATARGNLSEALAKLRSVCRDLRPPALKEFGLEPAIRSHATRFAEMYPHVQLSLNLEPDGDRLDESTRLALFRIMQEMLSNAARHSGTEAASVGLSLDAGEVELRVSDDGKGFVLPDRWVDLAREGHLGLVGARERAESVGGTFVVESVLGSGTTCCVRAPFVPPGRPSPSADSADDAASQ